MTCDTEHYYAVQTFLEDDELYKIWNIIEIAMNREGAYEELQEFKHDRHANDWIDN